MDRKKIAVIGGGISGLGSALLLQQKHEVHLFEAALRLGGHAYTYHVAEDEKKIPVDVGFLVYNELTYPHLTGMLKYLEVKTCASDMSLSVRCPRSDMEWAGDNLRTVFAQKRNLFRPRFLLMLRDVLKFHRQAEQAFELSRRNGWTIQDLLDHGGYSKAFADWYLLPMAGAIWSTPAEGMRQFPAESFFHFCRNHRMLQVNDRPQWRTIEGGSENYVQSIAKRLSHVHLSAPVQSVERTPQGICLRTNKEELFFDAVIFATHVPITKKILQSPSVQEEKVLNSFSVLPNTAVLHRDSRDMPKKKSCWASWNVLAASASAGEAEKKMSLTYYLNRLQPLGSRHNRFVTLNPASKLSFIDQSFQFDHPYFDIKALHGQRELDEIQGLGGVYYAGAWTRFGFHEDGLMSAVHVANRFGIQPPWVRS